MEGFSTKRTQLLFFFILFFSQTDAESENCVMLLLCSKETIAHTITLNVIGQYYCEAFCLSFVVKVLVPCAQIHVQISFYRDYCKSVKLKESCFLDMSVHDPQHIWTVQPGVVLLIL